MLNIKKLKKDQKVIYNNEIITICEIWRNGTLDAKEEEINYFISTYEKGYTEFIPIKDIKPLKLYQQTIYDYL